MVEQNSLWNVFVSYTRAMANISCDVQLVKSNLENDRCVEAPCLEIEYTASNGKWILAKLK